MTPPLALTPPSPTRWERGQEERRRCAPLSRLRERGGVRAGRLTESADPQTSTRSIPPLLALATYSGIQFSPRILRAISTTM